MKLLTLTITLLIYFGLHTRATAVNEKCALATEVNGIVAVLAKVDGSLEHGWVIYLEQLRNLLKKQRKKIHKVRANYIQFLVDAFWAPTRGTDPIEPRSNAAKYLREHRKELDCDGGWWDKFLRVYFSVSDDFSMSPEEHFETYLQQNASKVSLANLQSNPLVQRDFLLWLTGQITDNLEFQHIQDKFLVESLKRVAILLVSYHFGLYGSAENPGIERQQADYENFRDFQIAIRVTQILRTQGDADAHERFIAGVFTDLYSTDNTRTLARLTRRRYESRLQRGLGPPAMITDWMAEHLDNHFVTFRAEGDGAQFDD